ncbi:MAG: Cro/C1-type DNA-binding domain [Burkholderiales bacterium]|jgi:transcriptional regulator with XRE-family HTH domain|nr:Cro/C1-type DNA-binding domain [Burkholderiales bacterium]
MSNIINNLQYLIQKRGITVAELAATLSVSTEQITRLKNGELKNPPLETVIRLSKYFDISLESLVFEKLVA